MIDDTITRESFEFNYTNMCFMMPSFLNKITYEQILPNFSRAILLVKVH